MSRDPIIQQAVEAIQKQPNFDYASNMLWKAEEEWQMSLYYWSSRFRAINWQRVNYPIPEHQANDWSSYYGAEVGFMVASIGMATLLGHKFELPVYLASCIRGEELHPNEYIDQDHIRPYYQHQWWTKNPISFPPEGVQEILEQSLNWYKWVRSGSLPSTDPHLETATLSPENIRQIISVTEKAREKLAQQISEMEAYEASVTEEIEDWEEIIYISSLTDKEYQRGRKNAGSGSGGS